MIDWNAIATIAGWVAAVAAIVTLIYQQWQSNFSTNLDYLWRLQDQFSSSDMATKRTAAARQLLGGNTNENRDTDAVLDFFDLTGYLIKRHALDEEAAWMMFSDAGFGYWYGAEKYMAAARLQNPLYWEHFKPLIHTFISIETSKGDLKQKAVEARARARSPVFLHQEAEALSSAGLSQRAGTLASGRAALARVDVPASTPE